MKIHSTNYFSTFIEVPEDCAASVGIAPPARNGEPTVARLQYEMMIDHPYQFTSDEVIFSVFASRNSFDASEWEEQRQEFFSKGQACFRASPLAKSYGWGVHSNEEGKIALYGVETEQYQNLLADALVKKLKAMRAKRK